MMVVRLNDDWTGSSAVRFSAFLSRNVITQKELEKVLEIELFGF